MSESMPCPCGSQKLYRQCCAPLHIDERPAATAEALMRSRFSAFYLAAKGKPELCDYLLNTWHKSQYSDAAKALQDLKQSALHQQWHSLKIIETCAGQAGDKVGIVQFIAFFTPTADTGVQQLHERSNFCFEDGRWFYIDGSFQADIKLQRNEPCWCGSGKKMKKCHNG